MTLGRIKKWITDTLSTSQDFTDYCTSNIGSKLNFYRSSPTHKVQETLPFLTVDGYEKDDDRESSGYSKTFSIGVSIGIEENEDYIVDANGVKAWDTTDKVELIAEKANEILNSEVSCGIDGNYSIRVIKSNVFITAIGEADDVEAQVILIFGILREV